MPVRSSPRPRKPARRVLPTGRRPAGATRSPLVLDPIITMNSGGFIQSSSDSVEQIFGWTPSELFGKNVRVLIPEPRRSALDRYLDRYRHASETKVLQRTRRFDAVRKDGTPLQIELSMSRADIPPYAGPYFIGIVRDVSHQIEVGDDPKKERSRLQHLITEQTRALATANLRLQFADRLASLGTLAAGLGHDMNNVLLPVRARLNALEHAGIDPAARGHITAVRRSIAYLQQLSDGLHFLALDPDSAGAVSEDGDGATKLAHWWKQVGALLRKAIPKHVKLKAALSARLPAVAISPQWLTQAVLNLIVNAGEAIPTGRRNPLVRIWAEPTDDGRSVRLGVTDNGRGMPAEIQRRAFDLFFTTKSRGMGTGLGLAMVRKVAERAGGSAVLTSSIEGGTTVVLTLPVAPVAAGSVTATMPGGRRASLSVRDHRSAALISQILIGAKFHVRPDTGKGPGKSDLWVTDPTPAAMKRAELWKRHRSRRAVVLLGAPPKSAQKRWAALGATIIDPPDDFEAMRHAVGLASDHELPNHVRKAKP